jgi:hypothetical protein
VAAALAAGRPGDERDLALNSSSHCCSSSSFSFFSAPWRG